MRDGGRLWQARGGGPHPPYHYAFVHADGRVSSFGIGALSTDYPFADTGTLHAFIAAGVRVLVVASVRAGGLRGGEATENVQGLEVIGVSHISDLAPVLRRMWVEGLEEEQDGEQGEAAQQGTKRRRV